MYVETYQSIISYEKLRCEVYLREILTLHCPGLGERATVPKSNSSSFLLTASKLKFIRSITIATLETRRPMRKAEKIKKKLFNASKVNEISIKITDATPRSQSKWHVHVFIISMIFICESIWIVFFGVREELFVAVDAQQRNYHRRALGYSESRSRHVIVFCTNSVQNRQTRILPQSLFDA